MNVEGYAGFHDRIRIAAISLERPRRVDHYFGRYIAQLRKHIAVTIETVWFKFGRPAEPGAEGLRSFIRSTGDHQCKPLLFGQHPCEPTTEIPVSTENENPGHVRNRSAY